MKKLSVLKFLLFSFFCFVLFFAFLPSIINKAHASSVIFQDNFEDGNSNGWTNVWGPNLWQVASVSGSMRFGARIESGGTLIDTVGPSLGTSNYQIDFDYLPVTNGTTSTVDRNLDFRWVPDASLGGWKIYEVHFLGENYFWTNFGYPNSTSPIPLANNQINHIRVIFQDQRMQLFLNGTQIIDYLDTTYAFTDADKIGLRIGTGASYPTEVWFDNIVVTSLDPSPSPTPTPIPVFNLDVPVLKQTSNPWQSQIYDYAKKWSPSDSTINSWGCALTSGAMILKYHGINKLPNGTILNPGTLNSWLKNQKDGYLGTGWVNWLAISRLSKLAKSINNITAFDALQYSRTNTGDKNKLTTDINNLLPDILEVPGHFVVAKGINGSTFNINDPYYNRTTLNDYSNTFLTLGTYTPSFTDLSYIMLTTNPGINIILKDSNNSIVGESFIQQPLANDNHPSQTNSPIQIFYLPKPNGGNYTLQLSSSNKQNYNLNVYFYNVDGDVNSTGIKGVLNKNKQDTFVLSFDRNKLKNDKIKHKSKEHEFENEVDKAKKWFEDLF